MAKTIRRVRHTVKDGENLVFFLKKTGFPDAKLIGSLSKGKKATYKDIDILLPNHTNSKEVKEKLKHLLEPHREYKPHGKSLYAREVSDTDWGGFYFHNTHFGNVDIFFTDKDFTY